MRVILFIVLAVSTLFATDIKLTEKQANFIAQKVWQNEGAGLDKYLVHWNDGEDFASVGIGHFIWFSEGHTERFREVFPMVLASMEEKGVEMPGWLNSKTPLPWNSKEAFYKEKKAKSKKHTEAALPQMLETIEEPEKKERIKQRFYEVMHNKDGSVNERGLYVLLDYTNFKGEGTLKSERYNGQGWGLLQVLEHMNPKETNKQKAFAESAKTMLSRRIKNSPPTRGEERWRKGWNVRLETYWK